MSDHPSNPTVSHLQGEIHLQLWIRRQNSGQFSDLKTSIRPILVSYTVEQSPMIPPTWLIPGIEPVELCEVG